MKRVVEIGFEALPIVSDLSADSDRVACQP